MNNGKIEIYKKALLKEKSVLEAEIKTEEKIPDFGHDLPFFEEKSDEADALTNQRGVAQDLKKRLNDLELALQKIELGGYGFCEKCRGVIGEEILDIDPESRFCKDCKTVF
jgi:RNA polymerase-binding transcription factor DksA